MKVDFYKHSIPLSSVKNLKKILNSDIITYGKVGESVEKKIAKYLGVKNVILTSSWTTGAIITLLSLKLKKNDEVIIPSMTFSATANVVEILGAKAVFVDVEKETLLANYNQIVKKINKKTRAIIPVHLYGNMFDTKKLNRYIKKKRLDIHIIEDSAHAFESSIKGYRSGKWSTAAIFSFYATKNITCGEGGAIATNDNKLAKKLKKLRSFGLSQTALEKYKSKKYNDIDMQDLGINAKLPDLLSFLLLPQIRNINKNLLKRKKIYENYQLLLKNVNVDIPKISENCLSAFHIFVIAVKNNKRDEIINYLKKKKIGCSVHYKPVHQLTYYRKKYKLENQSFPISTKWGKNCITLPFHLKLTLKDQYYVIKTLRKSLEEVKIFN
jgi:UDP-4-amino-4-deoxy-L-arabinose-oxoglutarate aminotransferase